MRRFVVLWTLWTLPGVVFATEPAGIPQFPEDRWMSAMEAVALPGFAVAVTDRQGIVYARGFGHRSLEPSAPFTATTSTYVASVTKVFTATAIMQLAEGQRLSLDEPVRTYLPRFSLKDAYLARTITIRDLLCHRYGLDSAPIVFAEAYTGQIDDEKFYRLLAEVSPEGKWKYSNLHFTILGRVIKAVTGMSWQEYLREHIFLPAGLSGATADADVLYALSESAVPLAMAAGQWQEAAVRKSNSTMHAAGGMGASATDLAKWTGVFLNGGKAGDVQILEPDSVAEMLAAHTRPGTHYYVFERPEMGLGWYLGRLGAERLVHHFGSYTGAHAHCSFMPDHGIGVAVVANSNEASRKLLHQVAVDIYNAYLGHAEPDPWPPLIREMQGDAKKENTSGQARATVPGALSFSLPATNYAGQYINDDWGTLAISFENENLCGSIGDLQIAFLPDKTDELAMQTTLGRHTMRFEVEEGHVAGVRITELWGKELVFRSVNLHE